MLHVTMLHVTQTHKLTSNTRDALSKHVDREDKTTVAICDGGSNYKSRAVIVNEKGQTFFVGKDVAQALGYKNPSNALQTHVDSEDKTSYLIQVSGSNYQANTTFINESGLYSMVLRVGPP